MITKRYTMEHAASTLQAPESSQASAVDDSSAKTIEFLRARLLAERAASKAARQQAQEISDKVKALNARLQVETENRKEVQAAMGRVFTILKAKGLPVEGLVSTDLENQLERGGTTLDDIKEMNKGPQDSFSSTTDPSIDKEVSPEPPGNKGKATEVHVSENRAHSTTDLRTNGVVSEANWTLETHSDSKEALPLNTCSSDVVQSDSEENASLRNDHCEVQLAVRDKPVVYTDKTNCMPNFKEDLQTSQTTDKGSSVTQKLKAMLQQIEEEVSSLPTEQPLKVELQGWVDHVAGVLDKEREGALEMHAFNCNTKAGAYSPIERPVPCTRRKNVAAAEISEKPDMGKTLSIVHEEMLQQTNTAPPLTDNNGAFPPIMYPPPTGRDSALPSRLYHRRQSSCDSLHFWQEPPNKPMHPQMMMNGISHSLLHTNSFTANGHCTPYLREAHHPTRSSDTFSAGDASFSKAGFRQGQGRGLHLERPAGYRYVDPKDIQLRKGHAYPHPTYIHPVRDVAEYMTSIPLHDAALSLVDVRKGRLGDILMALDAARQHISYEEQPGLYAEKQLFLTPTPSAEITKYKGGCRCGDDEIHPSPYEYFNHTWRSRAHSQTPIIQFPPSPASEHSYSPFERPSRHHRSSSVSTNSMVSAWESYLQHRGEEQLGNGITLYTD